jgi:tetratricopeptide (TPR) repeat protein
VLLERYIRVVLSQPGTAFPLQRLAQLYREKDGSLARGIADFEARARSGVDAYAATVALAGMYKQDGRPTEAVAAYERAIALKKDDPSAVLALARLLEDSGDRRGARNRYEQALLLQTARTDREQTLRTLMGLALDDSDWAQAQAFHRKLLQLEPTSLFVRGELGRELFNRGEFAQAETELKDVVVAAAGDNRALAPALKELGRAQVKAHEHAAALSTLKRALVAAGDQSALRAEIYATIAEIYRADQQLPVLVKELEDEHPSDLSRLALLGGLYEEVGDGAKAIETYRRAILSNPRQVDLRLRMIRLLQANGDLDRAIAEYEGLIQAAPDNPQFVFEEGEALMQRGDRARAIRLVSELEARASNDEEVLARVAEFYGRIGENERSLRVLQRLAATSGSSDPGHLVDLGDRYFQDGRVPLALETWKRILTVVEPRARALAALGDVYLEHDMGSEAVAAYREASLLDPKNLGYKKSLAASQERVHAYREARALYEEIAAKAQENGDRALVRECRTRIVTLWGLERVIEQHLPSLRAQFGAAPPDPEAGRMLAEALLHLRRLPEAEATLRRVIDLSPGDAETYLALERVLVQESKIADAIGVLERLAALDPKRARELYERMAQYALQTYRDEDAIRYAARAVELNPDDAEGHRRLGEMYRSKQDVDHAITEFRAAIAKNDRLFLVYFELADLLLSRNQADEADRLFRSVVRGAPDEELVGRAARLSMQINVGKGTLESLEQDLLPLAIGNPQRPIYRRLLVETYGSLTFGLVQRVRHGTADESALARQALGRIGARAVKPLLDALADADVSQQRIAIDVLAYVQNRNAALPLFAFATGPSELALRTRAMLACGALADGALVPKYEALLFPTDRPGDIGLADPVGVAAVWGLARMENPRALPLLRRLAADGPPAMRALAVLGLGMARETGATAMVADIARSPDAGSVAKAAAAYALGDLDAQAQVPALLEIAEDGEPLPRRMALLALARLSSSHAKEPPWQGAAAQAMADAIFVRAGDETVSDKSSQAIARTATIALATLASHGAGVSGWARARDAMPTPDGPLDVETLLDELAPREASSAEKSAAIVLFEEPIRRAAMSALRTSGPRATAVLDALGDGDGEFLPFVVRGSTGPAAEAARRLADALEPDVVPLAKHPDAAIRAKAIVLVARSSSDAATDAVVSGLEDASEEVERVALSSLGAARSDGTPPPASARAAAAVARILATHQNWAMRVLAAEALGRLGAAGVSSAASSLGRAATTDPYALVRQAALEALAAYDATAGKALARRVATMDPEPRVRDAALLLARSPGER